jgi:hypothetical protein
MANKRTYRRLLVLSCLLVLIFISAFLWFRPLINVGSGYAAKHGCSCHYLQGRSLEDISEKDLNFPSFPGLPYVRLTEGWRHDWRDWCPGALISSRASGVPWIPGVIGILRRWLWMQARGAVNVQDAGLPPDYGGFDRDKLSEALDFGMAPVPGGGARGNCGTSGR